jgi:hypothetical protein
LPRTQVGSKNVTGAQTAQFLGQQVFGQYPPIWNECRRLRMIRTQREASVAEPTSPCRKDPMSSGKFPIFWGVAKPAERPIVQRPRATHSETRLVSANGRDPGTASSASRPKRQRPA